MSLFLKQNLKGQELGEVLRRKKIHTSDFLLWEGLITQLSGTGSLTFKNTKFIQLKTKKYVKSNEPLTNMLKCVTSFHTEKSLAKR